MEIERSSPIGGPNQSVGLTKITEEPGFIAFDLRGSIGLDVPSDAGILAFVRVDADKETIIKLFLLEDLSQGFLTNLRYCGRADRIAYLRSTAVYVARPQLGSDRKLCETFTRLQAKYHVSSA